MDHEWCKNARDGWVCTMPPHDVDEIPHVAWTTKRELCAVWWDTDAHVSPVGRPGMVGI